MLQGRISSTFTRYYFSVSGRQLNCFRDNSQGSLLSVVPLCNAKCFATVPHGGHEKCFRVVLPDSTLAQSSYLFAADSDRERRLWMATIQRLANITPPPNRVIFFYGRGGGGHKASANAVRDCLQQDDYEPCDVKMEDIGLLLEAPILGDYVKRAFNLLGVPGGDDLYNFFMAKGWYRIANFITSLGQGVIDKNATAIGDWLCEYFAAEQPALVVSFVPFVNKVMREALQHVCPGVSLLTVITDMEHSEAHNWIDPYDGNATNHTIVAGGSHLQSQARELGYGDANLLCTGGMVVHPAYYQRTASPVKPLDRIERRSVREQLDSKLPTAVMFFGGFGPPQMEAIAEQLLHQFELNLVLLVGKNDALKAKFEAKIAAGLPQWTRSPVLVDGFIPPSTLIDYIGAASCVIGKPGPGVVSEAAVLGVPFVTEHNERTMDQEVCVVDFVRKEKIGVIVRSLTEPFPPDLFSQLEDCRRHIAGVSNNAVFDVSAFCEEAVRLMGTGAGAVPATPEKIPPLSSACKTRVERLPSPEWGALVTNINVAVSPPNWSTSPGKGRAAFEFIPITSAEEIGSPPIAPSGA